jgi:aminoglycoside 3-N-acetyltransferase I
VRILEATTVEQVEAAAPLYDNPVDRGAATAFLADPRHHLLVALDDAGRTVGFVSGVETTHPDKGTEMFLYELAVAEDSRQRVIGKALTTSLADLARRRGC